MEDSIMSTLSSFFTLVTKSSPTKARRLLLCCLFTHFGSLWIGNRFIVLDLLGKGTFGQVARCLHQETGEEIALKAIKNKPVYRKIALSNEVEHLEALNKIESEQPPHHQKIIRMIEHFDFKNHLFIAFELLDISLYEVLKETKYNGLTLGIIRNLSQQVLEALSVMFDAGIIHSDIKPENILFQNPEDDFVKLIDLGSSSGKSKEHFSYIQSRFYRAPEVILGLPYGLEIDMWSFGCLAAELYIGLPFFPGNSDYDQLRRIIETCGNSMPSIPMIIGATNKVRYFTLNQSNQIWFKTLEEYAKITKSYIAPPKDYHSLKTFEDMLEFYNASKLREAAVQEDKIKLPMFIDFVQKILKMVPKERMTPQQALEHPFIKDSLSDFNTMKRREKAESMLLKQKNPTVQVVSIEKEGPGLFGFSLVRNAKMETSGRAGSCCCTMRKDSEFLLETKTQPKRSLSFQPQSSFGGRKASVWVPKAPKPKLKGVEFDSTGSTDSSFK